MHLEGSAPRAPRGRHPPCYVTSDTCWEANPPPWTEGIRMYSSRMCTARFSGHLGWEVSAWGGGGVWLRGRGVCPWCVHLPPWPEFLTHACENITFPQLLLRAVKTTKMTSRPDTVLINYWQRGINLAIKIGRNWQKIRFVLKSDLQCILLQCKWQNIFITVWQRITEGDPNTESYW